MYILFMVTLNDFILLLGLQGGESVFLVETVLLPSTLNAPFNLKFAPNLLLLR